MPSAGGVALMQPQSGGTGPVALMQSQTAPGGGVPMGVLPGQTQAPTPSHGAVYATQQQYYQQQPPGHAQQGYPGPTPVSQPPQARHVLQPPPPGTNNYY